VAGSCEHGDELPSSKKGGGIYDNLSYYQLLKKDFDLCSEFLTLVQKCFHLSIVLYNDALFLNSGGGGRDIKQ
jgi:hypothetical protein